MLFVKIKIEEKIYPFRLDIIPTLGTEILNIFPEYVFTAVHRVHTVQNLCASFDKQRRFSILSAALWKNGVAHGFASVCWDDRMYAKRCGSESMKRRSNSRVVG
jgi:hypothetical protein